MSISLTVWRVVLWPVAPLAAAWASRAIGHIGIMRPIGPIGRTLTPVEQALATQLGVAAPERVRVVLTPTMPWPGPRWLHRLASRLGFPALESIGLCLGHTIFLHPAWARPAVLAHELVHTAQCERLGGLRPFLHRYLAECLAFGYAEAPLEREARDVSTSV